MLTSPDDLWAATDRERARVADLLDGLDEDQWATPSLCAEWTVRDVGAHLTLAQMGPGPAAVALVRSRLSFDRMIRDTARRAARGPTAAYGDALRAMAGSRRKAPGVSPVEPLSDALVHGQDIARPLGLERPMPVDAAEVALQRCWSMGFPFFAQRRLRGLRLVATDSGWTAGQGQEVWGRTEDLLLLVTGRRDAALPRLEGAGVRVRG